MCVVVCLWCDDCGFVGCDVWMNVCVQVWYCVDGCCFSMCLYDIWCLCVGCVYEEGID